MDNLRAMREARYEAAQKAAQKTPGKPSRGGGSTASAKAVPVAPPVDGPEPKSESPADQLCGHRSMNGRTCTREHGHAAKNHRYS